MAWALTNRGLIPLGQSTSFLVHGRNVVAYINADGDNVVIFHGDDEDDCWQYIGRLTALLTRSNDNTVIAC